MRQLPELFTFALIFLFISSPSYAQPDGVRISKKSSWIKPVNFDASARPNEGQTSGYYYLLLDEQENTISQEDYYHYAYVILTSEGIQNMSDLSFDFDPSYQTLALHEIRVIRGENSIDQLSKNMQVIQREQSMDRYLYDGSMTAIVNLKDVRVGDIVEYSFTRKGYNPVLRGHISRMHYFNFYESIEKFYKKLIFSASRKIQMKDIRKPGSIATISRKNNEVHYEWSMNKTITAQTDGGAPAWHESYDGVMLSDFESWNEVGEWAKNLFKVSDTEKRSIEAEVEGKFPAGRNAEYVISVIRFVQDEVRYLGFESGINSHKPFAPKKVYDQRFGDCKDKSLLLATLLQLRGIEAHPMLVNTTLKHAIDDRLAAANIFDHCVVQINFDGKVINVDPTITNQGGSLEHIYFPDYKRGLVVDDTISGLDSLAASEPSTTTEVHNFELANMDGEAMLTIRTTYTGGDADIQRAQFATSSLDAIKKNYTTYYANIYPDITSIGDVAIADDRIGNFFTVEEKYKIPTFWKPVEDREGIVACVFQPLSLTSYFDIPKSIQQRTSPYYLSYPVDIYHTTHVSMPIDWTVEPVDKIIENKFYQFEYTVNKIDREMTRMMHYKTYSDHIPAEKISTFMADHAKMYNDLVYQVTYNRNIAVATKNQWTGIPISMLILAVGAYLMFLLYSRYDPAPARYMKYGMPIGGWLILMSLGICFTPFRMVYDIFSNAGIYDGTIWTSYWATKQYGLFLYVIVANSYNIFKFLFSVLLVVLFFKRRSSFPLLMTIQIALSLVMTIIDGTMFDSLDYKEVVRAVAAAAIWIPYLHMSQRVKETFVIRSDRHDDNNELAVDEHHTEVASTASDLVGSSE